MGISLKQIEEGRIYEKVQKLGNADSRKMLEIHKLLEKMCNPYVPMQEGVLLSNTVVTPEYVEYPGPYAHYMYMGAVYGPNIPIIEDGIVVGWWSPPGKEKHPTGWPLQYSKEKHMRATHHWKDAMLKNDKNEFLEQVKEIMLRKED